MSTTTSTATATRKGMQAPGSVSVMAVPINGSVNGASLPTTVSNASAGPSSASSVSTLRSLYPRAAHALLQRDFALTQALLESAFELLPPPSGSLSVPDALDMHRRKWEILRITLETSAYSSPPVGKRVGVDDVLPPVLRANLMLSVPGLLTALHSRSIRLFTPKHQSPKAAFLPAQILVPLVLSSLKLECPEVGRSMIEDWLAQRDSVTHPRSDLEGYERVLELYCLHVLPRLHEWEYAHEFLEYESELPDNVRQHFKTALRDFRNREIEAARTIPSPPPTLSDMSNTSSRTASPSPSVGSDSSSDTDDTHSTRTVVPHSSRAKRGMNGLSPLTPTPSASSTSVVNTTQANGHVVHGKRPASPVSAVRLGSSRSSRGSTIAANSQQGAVSKRPPPSAMALVLSTLRSHLAQLGPSRLLFAFLCILLPMFSFLIRLRRRRSQQPTGTPGTSLEAVRRRLAGQQGGGVLSAMWAEVVRAVGDTVRMAGGGLV